MTLIRIPTREIKELSQPSVDGMTSSDRDEMAIPSYTHVNPLVRWIIWRRYEVIHQIAKLENDLTVLEFGCGLGLFLPTLAASCRRVYAIDLFPTYAKRLTHARRAAVQFIDRLEDIPDGELDLIVAADVLEHVDDLGALIAQFRRKLEPTGRVIVSGPTENVAYKIARAIAGFSHKGDYHHIDVDGIRRAFCERGFSLLRTRVLPLRIPPHLFKIVELRANG